VAGGRGRGVRGVPVEGFAGPGSNAFVRGRWVLSSVWLWSS
jgi:hypothetical protein